MTQSRVTGIIIQARFNSNRLPGKVLLSINGETILGHVLKRALSVNNIQHVVCAVPDDKESEALIEIANEYHVDVFKGSEEDVLERYYFAAKHYSLDYIIRITSDCPLIDPNICSEVLNLLYESSSDYACNNMPPTFPHGIDCEAFKFSWLERSYNEAQKPSEREHVTQYIRNHKDSIKVNLECKDKNISHHRWTIDTQKDFTFFEELFKYVSKEDFSYAYPLSIVEKNKTLFEINANQDRYEGLKISLELDNKV